MRYDRGFYTVGEDVLITGGCTTTEGLDIKVELSTSSLSFYNPGSRDFKGTEKGIPRLFQQSGC